MAADKTETCRPSKQLSLTYDHDYGIDKRAGWSVVSNGQVVTELQS